MPLQNDINAQLFAQIDVNSLNKELKAFIQQEVENGIKTAMTNLADGIVKKKLDAITPQLEANLQQKLEQAKTDLQGLLPNYLCTLTEEVEQKTLTLIVFMSLESVFIMSQSN